MRQQLVATFPDARRLVLVFEGWAAAPCLLDSVTAPEGYDVMAVWDYRDDSFDLDRVSRYDEIVIVAWSYGVAMAARFIDSYRLNITRRVAVNGTLHPVDALRGIDPAMFRATLDNLSARSVSKFYRRMAAGENNLRSLTLPERPIGELTDELAHIGRLADDIPVSMWDTALVADGDLIIPPEAQLKAWNDEAYEVISIHGPHMPDFDTVIRRAVVSKEKVARQFNRAAATYDANAAVQAAVAERLAGMIGRGPLGDVLEPGCGTGCLTRLLPECKSLMLWDIATDGFKLERDAILRECDAETAIRELPPNSVDAIVSASAFQWFNSLPRFLDECARVLRPGGMLCFSTFGDSNFCQLDTVVPGRRLFPSLDTLTEMMPRGLDIVESHSEQRQVTFDTPMDVLRHLRATGVNGFNNPRLSVADFVSRYPANPDGTASLTYNPVYIKAINNKKS